MSERYVVELNQDLTGWAVFTGCEGEDPKMVAWFKHQSDAEEFLKAGSNPEKDNYLFEPHVTRAHVDCAAWNDFREPPEEQRERILSEMLRHGQSNSGTDGRDPVLREPGIRSS